MPWKPWVEIEKRNTSNQEAKEMYRAVMDKETKVIPDLARLTSTTPQIALNISVLRDSIADNKTGLSNKEVEIAATIVAVFNGCVH